MTNDEREACEVHEDQARAGADGFRGAVLAFLELPHTDIKWAMKIVLTAWADLVKDGYDMDDLDDMSDLDDMDDLHDDDRQLKHLKLIWQHVKLVQ